MTAFGVPHRSRFQHHRTLRAPDAQERAFRQPRQRRGSWAIVASLIETCKLNGIDPYTYLADVLSRLVNLWPNARLDELLPWNWAAARDHLQRAA